MRGVFAASVLLLMARMAAAQVWPPVSSYGCPCKEGDLEFTNEEASECSGLVIALSQTRKRLAQNPGAPNYVPNMVAALRRCIERQRVHTPSDHVSTPDPVQPTPAAEPQADPAPDSVTVTIYPPPKKPTEADRKAAAARKLARETKRAEQEAKKQEVAALVQRVSDEFCGPAPERRAWNGIYRGLEDAFKEVANDPDSVDFSECTDLIRKGPPTCWVTACRVRAKNGFGARILKTIVFGKSHLGWREFGSR
jgi:hypothetical protein